MEHKLFWQRIGLLVVVLAAATAGTFLGKLLPMQAYAVPTGSMEPTIPRGALIFAGPGEVDVDDIIVYEGVDGRNVVHRVVFIHNTPQGPAYATQGDANPRHDAFLVSPDQVRGEVETIVPHLGWPWLMPYLIHFVVFLILVVTYVMLALHDSGRTPRKAWVALTAGGIIVLIATVPLASSGVGVAWPSSTTQVDDQTANPVALSAGTAGTVTVATDQNVATVEVPPGGSGVLWKEATLWACDTVDGSEAGCIHTAPATYADVPGARVLLPTVPAPAPTFYLEVVGSTPSTFDLRLYDVTAGSAVTASVATLTSATTALVRGPGFTLTAGNEYVLQSQGDTSGPGSLLYGARLVWEQSDPTATATHITLSHGYRHVSGNDYAVPDRGRVWVYEAADWDGITAARFQLVANEVSGNGDNLVRLYDRTAASQVHEFIVVGGEAVYDTTFPTSSLIDGHEYVVQTKYQGAGKTDVFQASIR